MRNAIAKTLNAALRRGGLACLTRKDFNRLNLLNQILLAFLTSEDPASGSAPAAREPVRGIVFSKDRACQLFALLESFFDNVVGEVPLHVLFTASGPRHLKAYEEVQSLFPDKPLYWTRQGHFRNDLIRLLETIHSRWLLFLVDDIVVTRPVDAQHWLAFPSSRYVPSLRLGEHIVRRYERRMSTPNFLVAQPDPCLLEWSWAEGERAWGYPLSVDGHLFEPREIRILANHLEFSGPNSFEGALQVAAPVFSRRRGLCYKEARLVNLPMNKVQVENNNYHGKFHQELLLERWEAKLKIDVRQLYQIHNESTHEEVSIEFVHR